jgi:YtxH-like protein
MIDLKDLRKQLAHLEKDDILKLFNMEERRTAADYIVPAAGVFSVGLLVGAGLGLLLAPKPGRELRQDLRNRLQGGELMEDRNLPAASHLGERARTA